MYVSDLIQIIIASISLFIACIAVFQSWYLIRETNRPIVCSFIYNQDKIHYLVIKNFGNQEAMVKSVKFDTDKETQTIGGVKWILPFSTAPSFSLAPGQAKVANVGKDLKDISFTVIYFKNRRKFKYKGTITFLGKSAIASAEIRSLLEYNYK